MRILFWTELFWPHVGGIQALANQTIPLLQQRGYEFAVVTSHANHDLPDRVVSDGISVYRFPFWQALHERNIELLVQARQGIIELKQRFKPDLVHLNFPDPTVFFHWQTLGACTAPTLVSLHLGLPEPESGKDSLLRQTLVSAQWVTANSNAVLKQARLRVPEIAARSTLVYPGLKTPPVPMRPVSFHEPIVLCVGRLAYEKGFDLALSAFGLLHARYRDARLIIVGDGPARSELETQATTLNIRSQVDFTGWVNPHQVTELMNTATVVVVPSRWEEAFGLVALEASLMGRPVVHKTSGGLPEIVRDQETGLTVERENDKELAAATAFLFEHPQTAIRMGEAGRLRANELFALDRYVNDSDALYKKIIAEWKPAPHTAPLDHVIR